LGSIAARGWQSKRIKTRRAASTAASVELIVRDTQSDPTKASERRGRATQRQKAPSLGPVNSGERWRHADDAATRLPQ